MSNDKTAIGSLTAAAKPAQTSVSFLTPDVRRAVPALLLGAIGAFMFRKKHPVLGGLGGLALGDAIDPILNRPKDRVSALTSLAAAGLGTFAALKWKKHPAIGYIAATALFSTACNAVGLPDGDVDGGQGNCTQKTVSFDPLQGLDINPVTVPPNTKRVSFWRNNANTVAVRLWFQNVQGGVVYTYDLAAGEYMQNPIPVAADVAQIGVQKLSGAETQARLIFEVCE